MDERLQRRERLELLERGEAVVGEHQHLELREGAPHVVGDAAQPGRVGVAQLGVDGQKGQRARRQRQYRRIHAERVRGMAFGFEPKAEANFRSKPFFLFFFAMSYCIGSAGCLMSRWILLSIDW